MKLTLLHDSCPNGRSCPRIYATDRGTLIVQGSLVLDAEVLAELELMEHETAVEIPRWLLPEVS